MMVTNFRSSLQTILLGRRTQECGRSNDDALDEGERSNSTTADVDMLPKMKISNFRSSLQSIESHGSIDSLLEGEDVEVNCCGISINDMLSSMNESAGCSRRSSLNMQGSPTSSIMVSFSNLNEREMIHLRKWKMRLRKTEVFDTYYFPQKWEISEMEALIKYFGLEDPTFKSTVARMDRRGSVLNKRGNDKASGNSEWSMISRSSFSRSSSEVRLTRCLTSYDTGSSLRLNDLSSSITKILTAPTQSTLEFIFFPYVHDPKSVLLKRGSVFLLDAKLTTERELMLFTHGFLIADVACEDALNLFLALSDREFVTEKSFLENLRIKFEEMDTNKTGEVEKQQVQNLFSDLGVPRGETIVSDLLENNSIPVTKRGQSEKVSWEGLHKALQGIFFQQEKIRQSQLTRRRTFPDQTIEESNGLKKFLSAAFQKEKKATRVEKAAKYSSVARIDSFTISCRDDDKSKEISSSIHSQTAFSITLKEQMNNPLLFVCSKPLHRKLWLDAFKSVVIRALSKTSSEEMLELKSKLGWQHFVIRSTLCTLVLENDFEKLRHALKGSEAKTLKTEISVLDEYNGYSPLHYATILGHTECMDELLKAGSNVTLADWDGLSPMYHALSRRNDKVADILEKYGADRNDDLKKLIAYEIQLQDAVDSKGQNSVTVQQENIGFDFSEGDSDEENRDALVIAAANQFNSRTPT